MKWMGERGAHVTLFTLCSKT